MSSGALARSVARSPWRRARGVRACPALAIGPRLPGWRGTRLPRAGRRGPICRRTNRAGRAVRSPARPRAARPGGASSPAKRAASACERGRSWSRRRRGGTRCAAAARALRRPGRRAEGGAALRPLTTPGDAGGELAPGVDLRREARRPVGLPKQRLAVSEASEARRRRRTSGRRRLSSRTGAPARVAKGMCRPIRVRPARGRGPCRCGGGPGGCAPPRAPGGRAAG